MDTFLNVLDTSNVNSNYVYYFYILNNINRTREITLTNNILVRCVNNNIVIQKANNGPILSYHEVSNIPLVIIISYNKVSGVIEVYIDDIMIFSYKLTPGISSNNSNKGKIYVLNTDTQLTNYEIQANLQIVRNINKTQTSILKFKSTSNIVSDIKSNKNVKLYVPGKLTTDFSVSIDKYIYYADKVVSKMTYNTKVHNLKIVSNKIYINDSPIGVTINRSKIIINSNVGRIIYEELI